LNPRLLVASSFAQIFSGPLQAAGSMSLQGVQRDNAGRLVATVKGDFRLSGVKPPFPPQVQAKPSLVEFQYQATAPVVAGAGEHDVHLKTIINHEGITGNISTGFSESQMKMAITLDQNARYTIDPARARIAALAAAPGVPAVAPGAAAPSMTAAQFVSREAIDAEKSKTAVNAGARKPTAGATPADAPARPPANPTITGGVLLSSQPAPAPTGKNSAANPANPPAATAAMSTTALPPAPTAAAPAATTALPSAPVATAPAPPLPASAAPPSLPSLAPAPSPFAGAQPLNPSAGASTLSGAQSLAPSTNPSTFAGAQSLTPSANASTLAGARALTPANASGNGIPSAFAGAIPLNPGNSTPPPKAAAPPPAIPSPFAGALPLLPASGAASDNTAPSPQK
jgi:hypothetical protein